MSSRVFVFSKPYNCEVSFCICFRIPSGDASVLTFCNSQDQDLPPSHMAANPSAHITFDHRNVTHVESGNKKEDSSYLQVFVFLFFLRHIYSHRI